MKFNKKIIIAFWLLFLGIYNTGIAQNIKFAETSLTNLKKGSKATGKPLFIYLYAEECTACERMEQLTFADPTVSNVVRERLLAAKIELSSEDGQRLTDKHKISLAPAVLFYNKKGKLILQQETAISSENILKLLNVLYDFDVDLSNTKVSSDRFNSVKDIELSIPQALSIIDSATIQDLKVVSERKIILKQPRKTLQIKAAKIPVLNQHILAKASKNKLKSPVQLFNKSKTSIKKPSVALSSKPVPKSKPTPSLIKAKVPSSSTAQLVNNVVVTKKIISVPEKKPATRIASKPLKRKTTASSATQNRLIQFGAFSKYDDVLRGMYKMKRKLDTPLTIIEEITNGRKMYKLVGADHMTIIEAQKNVAKHKSNGIDCFVRKAI